MNIKQFIRGTAIYSIGDFLNKGIGFLLLPFYTKIFSPSDYGVLELISITVTLLIIIFSAQLHQAIPKYFLASRTFKSKQSYTTGGWLHYVIVFSTLSFILIIFRNPISSILLENKIEPTLIIVASIFLFTSAMKQFYQNQLKWNFKEATYSILTICTVLLSAAFVFFFVLKLKLGLIGVYWGMVSGVIPLLIVAHLNIRSQLEFATVSLKRIKKMYHFGYPLIFSNLGIYVLQTTDRYFIKAFLSLHEVGLYSISFKIVSTCIILFSGVKTAFSAFFFSNYRQKHMPEFLSQFFHAIFIVCMLLFVTIPLFSPEFLTIMTSEAYYPAYKPISILLLAHLLYTVCALFAFGFFIKEKTKYYSLITIASGLANVLFNILLIPKYGVMGAALATMLSYAMLTFVIIKKSKGYYPFKINFKKVSLIFIAATIINGLNITFIGFKISPEIIAIKTLLILSLCAIIYSSKLITKKQILELKEQISKKK